MSNLILLENYSVDAATSVEEYKTALLNLSAYAAATAAVDVNIKLERMSDVAVYIDKYEKLARAHQSKTHAWASQVLQVLDETPHMIVASSPNMIESLKDCKVQTNVLINQPTDPLSRQFLELRLKSVHSYAESSEECLKNTIALNSAFTSEMSTQHKDINDIIKAIDNLNKADKGIIADCNAEIKKLYKAIDDYNAKIIAWSVAMGVSVIVGWFTFGLVTVAICIAGGIEIAKLRNQIKQSEALIKAKTADVNAYTRDLVAIGAKAAEYQNLLSKAIDLGDSLSHIKNFWDDGMKQFDLFIGDISRAEVKPSSYTKQHWEKVLGELNSADKDWNGLVSYVEPLAVEVQVQTDPITDQTDIKQVAANGTGLRSVKDALLSRANAC